METQPLSENTNQEKIANRLEIENRIKKGASWFYWIAALSVVNTVLFHSGAEVSFIVGLGMTLLADSLLSVSAANDTSGIMTFVSIAISVAIAGGFALFGFLGNKKSQVALIVGMIFYGFDAMIFVWAQDWLSFGFHLFAMWGIYAGVKALSEYEKLPVDPSTVENLT